MRYGALLGAGVLVPWCLVGQQDAERGVEELQQDETAYELVIEQLEKKLDEANLENDLLSEKVGQLQNTVRELASSLTEAKSELEELTENYKQALVNLELLGTTFSDEELRERLIKAASDLRLTAEEKEKLATALVAVSDAVEAYMKNAVNDDAQARLGVETALRGADEALGLAFSDDLTEKTLAEAKVITVKKEFNMVIVDVGSRQGLRVGTPVKIQRRDRMIGSALVIDVRDTVSGAIVLELNDPNESIKVEDAVRVDPTGV